MSATYIRVASDLHLEQFMGRNMQSLEIEHLPKDERDTEAVLVLAGDISASPTQLVQFLHLVENRFLRVVYVPGNHEYYRHEMNAWNPTVRDEINLHCKNTSYALGDVKCEQIAGVRFIFSTYWADGGATLEEQGRVGNGLWDFRIITLNGVRFMVSDMQRIHKRMKADTLEFLKAEKPEGMKNVVVSHHMPSYRLCAPRFGTEINGGFASNSDDILAGDHAPEIWIHGHTHDTIDTRLWNTHVVCNPSGYHRETRGSAYNTYGPKFIEL